MFNNQVLYLMLRLSLLLSTGCNDNLETAISQYSCLNSKGDILAILIGSKIKGWDCPAALETHPVLLKLDENSSLNSYKHYGDWVFHDMAWRPGHNNHFYYTTFEKVYGSGFFYEPNSEKWFKRGIGRLMMLDASINNSLATQISQDSYPNIITHFQWNPNGSLLAGMAFEPSSQLINSGELAVSYDGGRTCELTGIDMHSDLVWLNNKELYLMTDQNHTIAKVLCDGRNVMITERFIQESYRITFNGIFDKKLVYTAYPRENEKGQYIDKSRRLFVGDKLIYETNNPLFRVFAFPDTIILEADESVFIFDENLSVCHKRLLGRNIHILNYHPETNVLFLIRNWNTILHYNYTHNEELKNLFSVNTLNVNFRIFVNILSGRR
jgi:hypothetical protein